MKHPKKHNNITMSLMKPSEDGLILDNCNSQKPKEDIEDIMSHHNQSNQSNQIIPKPQIITSMQESHLPNKRKTSKDKSNISKNSIRTTQSSRTLVPELTLKERDFLSSLIVSSKKKLEKLWLPTKTALQDLTSHSSNIFVKSLDVRSRLFQKKNIIRQKNLVKTSSQSSPSSPVASTDLELIKTKKIKFYPNQAQKNLLEKLISTSRYIYNSSVAYNNEIYRKQLKEIQESSKCSFENCQENKLNTSFETSFFCKRHKGKKIKWKTIKNPIELRDKIIIKEKDLKENEIWLKETPYDCKELMIRSYLTGLNTNLSQGKSFEMKFKKKKEPNQIIFCNKKAFSIEKGKVYFFKKRLGINSEMHFYKKKPDEINHNPAILKQNNSYFLLVPFSESKPIHKATFKEVALDPGIRTFQTFYSPSGVCGDLQLRNKHIDKLNLRIKKLLKQKQNSVIRRKLNLSRTKIKNLVSDGHWKIIKFLVTNFETIYLPVFKIKDLIKKEGILSAKSKNRLLVMSHYQFKLKLFQKCQEYGRDLKIVSEEYTSKTCGNCGYIKNNLRGQKIYNCNQCKIKIDRDLNASRNILIRNSF